MVKHCLSPEPSRLVLSVVLGGCCSKGKQNANTFNLLSDADSTVQKRYNLGSWEQMTDSVFLTCSSPYFGGRDVSLDPEFADLAGLAGLG